MRILVLDDDRSRLSEFKRKLIGHVGYCVETAEEAIEKLSEGDLFEIVYLDHDLGGKINQPSGPGTGYKVAEWLSKHPDRKPAKIIIHSFNAPGATKMLEILPGSVYIPGVWAMKKIL